MESKYTVLMSLYEKENPEFLRISLESIFNQTVSPNEIVIVKDGYVPQTIENVLDFYLKKSGIVKIVSLDKNMGLGTALRVGVEHCSNDFVARMDTDDIAIPQRCELQLKAFNDMPQVDIVGGQISEFFQNPDTEQYQTKRAVPVSMEEIKHFSKMRNPFNHMTVMFRKQAVLDAGNYQDMQMFEDYYLWARMIMKGFIGINLKQTLVFARIGNGMYARRGGVHYLKKTIAFQKALYKIGFLSQGERIKNCLIRMGIAIAPEILRRSIYKNILRKR